jgi:hypothetical protein
MNIFGFQLAVKKFVKWNTINFLNYALILKSYTQFIDRVTVFKNNWKYVWNIIRGTVKKFSV